MSTLTRAVSYSLLLLMTAVLVGCQDLSVDNTNNPTTEQVLSTAEDVETLAGDTFRNFWQATQWCDNSMMYSTIADAHSCSWANWAMNDMSSEPRIEWNNNSAYPRAPSTEEPWFDSYRAVSNASDVLRAVENIGVESINSTLESETGAQRMQAFANFVLGLTYGHIAATFDRGFLVDETTDLSNPSELPLAPYPEVKDFAIQKLDRAIEIAEANDFVVSAEEDWVFGIEITNDDIVRLSNSYKARYEAAVARTPEERAAADWASISTWVDNGITETFTPIGNDDGDTEWDCMKFYGEEPNTWARADYRTIGPADESGGYEAWLDTPVADRDPFVMETADRRIQGPSGPESDGTYASFQGAAFNAFPPARGTYHYSDRTFTKYDTYLTNNANGPMPVMETAEMDLLKAEALLRTGGSTSQAANLIDNSRVGNGRLPSAAGTEVGSPSDDPNPLAPGPVTLWSMLKYEFNLETALSAGGLNYFTDRGWGDLVEGTPLHFPIPGSELETIGAANYTFGGVDGRCSAGNPANCLGGTGGGSDASSRRLAEDFVIDLKRWMDTNPQQSMYATMSPR